MRPVTLKIRMQSGKLLEFPIQAELSGNAVIADQLYEFDLTEHLPDYPSTVGFNTTPFMEEYAGCSEIKRQWYGICPFNIYTDEIPVATMLTVSMPYRLASFDWPEEI